SPFGPILLCGDAAGLTGLYFTDQKDCPPLADGPGVRSDSSRPGSGMVGGVLLRTLRPSRRLARAGGLARGKRTNLGQMTLFSDDAESTLERGVKALAGAPVSGAVSAPGDPVAGARPVALAAGSSAGQVAEGTMTQVAKGTARQMAEGTAGR